MRRCCVDGVLGVSVAADAVEGEDGVIGGYIVLYYIFAGNRASSSA